MRKMHKIDVGYSTPMIWIEYKKAVFWVASVGKWRINGSMLAAARNFKRKQDSLEEYWVNKN